MCFCPPAPLKGVVINQNTGESKRNIIYKFPLLLKEGWLGLLIISLLHNFISQPGWLILEEYHKIQKMKTEISNQPPRPQFIFSINKSALHCGHPSFKRRGKFI
jgi:hypothetical protein